MYYQPRVRVDKSFPLTSSFFQPLNLSQQRLDDLRAEAADALKQALTECGKYQESRDLYLAGSRGWRLHAELNGLTEYKRHHKTKPTTSESILFGTVDGNYLEFIRFFKSETREDYYNVQKAVFPFTIDAAVVHSVAKSELAPRSAYEGIKWAAYEPFALRFRMDSVHYECIGTGVDADCRPFAYRVVIPTAIDEVPDLFKAKRTVRTYAKSVTLAMPSERNGSFTELFMTMENDFKSNHVPRSFYKRYMRSLRSIGTGVAGSGKRTRFVLTARNEWASLNPRGECGVCTRSFSILRSKYTCAACSEVVCRKCTVKARKVVGIVGHAVEGSSSRFCKPCVKMLRDERAADAYEHGLVARGSLGSSASLDHHHEPSLSETSTEVSASDAFLAANHSCYVTTDPRRSSSHHEWVTTPTSKAPRRSRFASEQLHNKTKSSSVFDNCDRYSVEDTLNRSHLHFSFDTSSIDIDRYSSSSSASDASSYYSLSPEAVTREKLMLFDDDLTILEEDGSDLSSRSNVLFTIDTSEMTPASSLCEVPSPASSFKSISNSLQEQQQLLRQLRRHGQTL